jgi:hypothetical protein
MCVRESERSVYLPCWDGAIPVLCLSFADLAWREWECEKVRLRHGGKVISDGCRETGWKEYGLATPVWMAPGEGWVAGLVVRRWGQ